METLAKFAKELREDPKSLLIFFGLVVFFIGVSGAVPYAPNPLQGPWQIATVVLGLILVGLGLFLVFGGKSKSTPHGISIINPIPDATVGPTVQVVVEITGRIPEGHRLWLVRIYPWDNMYYPFVEIKMKPGEKTYKRDFDIGAKIGETREIGAYLFGPAGQALIDYQREAAQRHNKLLVDFNVPETRQDRYLPAFKHESIAATKTVVCQTVPVKRDR